LDEERALNRVIKKLSETDKMRSLFKAFRSIAALTLAASVTAAFAQADYPNRSVRIVVPYAAGGGADQVTRLIGIRLGERLKQAVVVENRGGGSNTIGMSVVAKAPADGYTLGLVTPTFLMTQSMMKNHPYDTIKDFSAVAMLGDAPLFLAIPASLPVNNLKEFVQYGKANQGQLNWASGGSTSTQGLAGLMFSSAAGLKTMQIQYKGSSQGMTDLLAGRVQFMFNPLPSIIAHTKSGKLKILGVASTERLSAHPDIPVIADTVPGFSAAGWFALVAPAGTPKEIVDRLNREIGEIIKNPEVQASMIESGLEPKVMSPAEFSKMMSVDFVKYAKTFADAGIKPE
jgi:tripartite-type tricarboxylate transporter receptor subunit TctC